MYQILIHQIIRVIIVFKKVKKFNKTQNKINQEILYHINLYLKMTMIKAKIQIKKTVQKKKIKLKKSRIKIEAKVPKNKIKVNQN